MNEATLQVVVLAKLIWLSVYAYFYGVGGYWRKWVRRFLAPFWLISGFLVFSHWVGELNWFYAICLPFYILAAHIGYGVNSKMMRLTNSKILTRAIVGLLFGVAALPIAIINSPDALVNGMHVWKMLAFSISLSVVFMSILGTYNITKNPRYEESLIAVSHSLIPLFML